VALYRVKKNRCWLWKALDRHTRRTLAWVVGRRDAATFRRLYERVKGVGRVYYTDDWPSYSAVLPPEQHVIGKTDTHTIERDNANTRHYLARMTRRGKVVSKSLSMVELTMKLHVAFTNPETYAAWQDIFLAVFE
jgi:insertion element IS1 protein InsB